MFRSSNEKNPIYSNMIDRMFAPREAASDATKESHWIDEISDAIARGDRQKLYGLIDTFDNYERFISLHDVNLREKLIWYTADHVAGLLKTSAQLKFVLWLFSFSHHTKWKNFLIEFSKDNPSFYEKFFSDGSELNDFLKKFSSIICGSEIIPRTFFEILDTAFLQKCYTDYDVFTDLSAIVGAKAAVNRLGADYVARHPLGSPALFVEYSRKLFLSDSKNWHYALHNESFKRSQEFLSFLQSFGRDYFKAFSIDDLVMILRILPADHRGEFMNFLSIKNDAEWPALREIFSNTSSLIRILDVIPVIIPKDYHHPTTLYPRWDFLNTSFGQAYLFQQYYSYSWNDIELISQALAPLPQKELVGQFLINLYQRIPLKLKEMCYSPFLSCRGHNLERIIWTLDLEQKKEFLACLSSLLTTEAMDILVGRVYGYEYHPSDFSKLPTIVQTLLKPHKEYYSDPATQNSVWNRMTRQSCTIM